MADVLIAGAGIAGSALAIALGRAGLRVEVFDGHTFPREKPCGEGLMPAGVAALGRLGLLEAARGRPLRGVRYHGWGLSAEAAFPAVAGRPAPALGQRRLHLDHTLFTTAATTPGVQVRTGAAVAGAIIEKGRTVGLRVGTEWHHAPLVVAADGALSPVRRSLGLEGPRPRRQRVGLRTHFRLTSAWEGDYIEVFIGDGYELYVTPLPDSEILVAGLSDQELLAGEARAALNRWIDGQPVLRRRLSGVEPLTPVAGRAPLALQPRAGYAPGAVLLGDAAGFIDPVTAGGMAQALLTAELLARYVPRVLSAGSAEGDRWLRRFDRQRRTLLRDYRLVTHLVLSLVNRPHLARPALRLLGRMPGLLAHLIGVAGGTRRLLGGDFRNTPPLLAPHQAPL